MATNARPGAIRRGLLLLAALYTLGILIFLIISVATRDRLWPIALLNNFNLYIVGSLIPVMLWFLTYKIQALRVAATIGLALLAIAYAPFLLPKRLDPRSGIPLKVATFNMLVSNTNTAAIENWLNTLDADIVFMQEVSATYADNGIQAALDKYPHQFTTGETMSNLILSKFPFESTEPFYLADEQIAQFTQQRAVITVSERQIALYSIHLNVPFGAGPRFRMAGLSTISSYDSTVRDQQLATLLTRLNAETMPYLVGGDFNISSQSPTYMSLLSELNDAYFNAGSGFGFTWPTRPFPGLRLDYLFYSYSFSPVGAEVGPYLGSDHYPVIARLNLFDPSLSEP